MNDITKHINDTNASYRNVGAGDAKNTDLFLDNEHYELFKDCGENITVRFDKTNLTQAILFIASILPRKFDQSSNHYIINYSDEFVIDQLAILDALFKENGKSVDTVTQIWNARKDVKKKNGNTDSRFYFNNLIKDIEFKNHNGDIQPAKFTIRNYLAGGFSNLTIKKASDGIFDIKIDNVTEPYNDNKEDGINDISLPAVTTHDKSRLQLIYYGAPGTGKSSNIKKSLEQDNIPEENIFRTTFHPDSDYSTFVGAYKPTMQKKYRYDGKVKAKYYEDDDLAGKKKDEFMVDKTIEYSFVPQAFLNAYMQAYRTSENVYLIIEEINRGNCAQIFGDLFQLLDRDENGYSEYPIKADADLKAFLEEELGKDSDGIKNGKLRLPSNLYIYATMNTSDQSLFPIDSAFKRRWDWKYMPISNAKKDWVIEVGSNHYDWWDFLKKINEKISTTTHSEDKKLGYFFCKATGSTISAETFTGKVIFYLWNDVFKDYDFNDAIFNDENGGKLTFDKFHTAEGCDSKVVEEKIAVFLNNLGVVSKNELDMAPEDEDGNPIGATQRNHDKFTINGGPEHPKNKLTYECVKEFIKLHPEMSADEVYRTWASLGDIVPHFIETKAQHNARTDNSKDRSKPLNCADTEIYVMCDGYGDHNGKANLLMEKVNAQNWGITIRRIPKTQTV